MKFSKLENRQFWRNLDPNSQDYSGDKNIVQLEDKFLIETLKSIKRGNLLDVGCGRGQRCLMFSKVIKGNIFGVDYSDRMIKIAKSSESAKIKFEQMEIFSLKPERKFDIITSCRCIVNTPTDRGQLAMIKKMESLLKPGGHLILVERSKQGLDSLNDLRKRIGLKPIPERFHNHYLNESFLMPKIFKKFKLISMNKLGVFYFVSRVLYPKMIYPEEPNQEHIVNKIAIESQNAIGDKLDYYGLQLMMHLQKKK
jgi:ubiquinone/menaquinone biosynthesis C-methylase UbiE